MLISAIACTGLVAPSARAWCAEGESTRSGCIHEGIEPAPMHIEASFQLRPSSRKQDAWTLHYVPEYSADPSLWQQPAPIEPQPSANSGATPKDDKKSIGESIWFATGVAIGFNVVSIAIYTMLPQDVTNWEGGLPEWKGLEGNFTKGPRWDNDSPYWNYVGHPIGGSEYYLLARNRDFGFWGSFAYSAGMSAFFEFFLESAYERASYQDLIVTPVAGTLLGELRYAAKQALINPKTGRADTTLGQIGVVVLDPIDAPLKLL
jgi:hypothetical protein